ncbi:MULTISPECIES: PAS domain-containing methyl-accepting chemotaxis protein [Ramlibacter]|uniref:PAS domain-containing protein n=1 Tax=Ramlibacter aquaticus TaxID=2780094 RepID=A0ABR9SIP2_9BURK|nr:MULTISPECIES: PAS domain-containing methyl-accepting chemotaxis protein [Ramlibacter]MBE7941779.1 PAS domain-containing protein [Ramlibacter aquaticus]
MRRNEPVTQREFDIPEGATLMSTTDTASHITYANDAFVAVSGFARDALMGQPHNLVRHPDMPRQVFADMWSTLKAGEPWSGLVKNRRADGDHYWVRAHAVPVCRNGATTGFMSVRTRPTPEEVQAAQAVYADMASTRPGFRLHRGVLLRRGAAALLNWRKTLSVRGRIRVTVASMWLFIMGFGIAMAANLLRLGSVTAVALAVVSLVLEWQIARPLEQLRRLALSVATGESREAVRMDRVDEIGVTMRSVNQLGLMFRWLVNDVSEQVLAVQTAAAEIAQGNDDLSARTEHAASSVQETAATMQQMTSTVRANADSARHADGLAGEASGAAARGREAVGKVVSTMGEIRAASDRIASIIQAIDGIAFQTNILALNAAVEAARAGEQGRGFSVVASEVRALAGRSADAAREIKALIGDSLQRVHSGTGLVDEAGVAMAEIVARVGEVSTLIARISASNAEQTGGIEQVGAAVGQLDQVTQQNAALVEQSTAASSSLKGQAQRLVEAVSVFR